MYLLWVMLEDVERDKDPPATIGREGTALGSL